MGYQWSQCAKAPSFFSADVCYLSLLRRDLKLLCAQLFNSPTGVLGWRLGLFIFFPPSSFFGQAKAGWQDAFLEKPCSSYQERLHNLERDDVRRIGWRFSDLSTSFRLCRPSVGTSFSVDPNCEIIRGVKTLRKWLVWYLCTGSLEFQCLSLNFITVVPLGSLLIVNEDEK